MQSHSRIFTDKYLDIKSAHLEKTLSSGIDGKIALIRDWQDGIRSGRILHAKEEQLQSSFLRLFFGDVLGYEYAKGSSAWNLEEEQKTVADSTKTDGALGFFTLDSNGKTCADIKAVIELKDARTDLDKPQTRKNDRRTPVQQAFDYANAMGGTCRWVIVSDFTEIRLYFHNDRTRYESFDILSLDRDMKRFLFLLHRDRLIAEKGESFTEILYRERQEQEKNISRQFYADYRQARLHLFHHIREENQGFAESLLLNKTQKLLDRILFVCFCEDFGILPYFTFRSLLKNVKEDRFNRSDTKIYQRVKALFDAINNGYPEENINRFNGGLFADDEMLDALLIKDAVLEHVIALEQYDFASDLNVNILGHIFEQSVTDMEELKAEIAGQSFDRKKGKRKKEGIFYTPEYITRYIVEEAVGGWLADRKAEIGFDRLPELTQADYDSVKKISKKRKANKNIDLHIQALETYREKLKNIRVLDPACGSGAFLNQVFDFLYKEGQKVNNEIAMRKGGQREVFDLDKDILTNNIFGVDLNAESVEITKLSMWLKTANKNKELTTLDNNIKCGNSLIDDPAVAGEKAFDWNAAFPEIMQNGGFDVVVGNPPYVRADIDNPVYQKQRKWMENSQQYETLYEKWDLMIPFIEKSLKLLKKEGHFSFIVSNAVTTSKYSFRLLDWILKNFHLKSIDYFEEIEVFENVGVIPVILSVKKTEKKDETSKIIRKEKFDNAIVKKIRPKETEKIGRKVFKKNYSDFKIIFQSVDLGDICYLSVGMVINADEKTAKGQFAKNDLISTFKDEIHSKIYIEGKNIQRYKITENNYLEWNTERVPDKLRRKTFPELYEGAKIMRGRVTEGIFDDTGIVCNDSIVIFKRFCDLKGVENSSIRNSIAKNSSFSREELEKISEGFDLKYILAILNSGYANRYLNNSRRHRLENYFYPDDFRNLPIPDIVPEHQQPFIKKTDIMLTQNKALHHLKQDFLTFVKNELKPVSISKKLENWQDSDWDHFKTEMKKAKVSFDDLNLKDRKQWQDYFLEQQKKALKIKSIIDKTDKEIDKMVYNLYGLTEEEIRIVEGTK